MKFTQDDVTKEVRHYQKILNLDNWDISVGFTVSDQESYADCIHLPQYMKADLSFSLDKIKSKKLLRQSVVHELMHVVLSPYTSVAMEFAGPFMKILDNLEETMVTLIEQWKVWSEP